MDVPRPLHEVVNYWLKRSIGCRDTFSVRTENVTQIDELSGALAVKSSNAMFEIDVNEIDCMQEQTFSRDAGCTLADRAFRYGGRL